MAVRKNMKSENNALVAKMGIKCQKVWRQLYDMTWKLLADVRFFIMLLLVLLLEIPSYNDNWGKNILPSSTFWSTVNSLYDIKMLQSCIYTLN